MRKKVAEIAGISSGVDECCIMARTSLKKAMRKMSEGGEKTVFVIDKENRLIGSLTDGDIRKWILSGGNLSRQAGDVCNNNPIFIHGSFSIDDVKKIMLINKIDSLPVLDINNQITKILKWNFIFGDIKKENLKMLDVPVVIMAGGKGSRLDPLTKILPKPLIPIGEKPIIEIIIEKFIDFGARDFFISLNHKSRMIKSYFDDTRADYTISYLEEEKPLGTAGSLGFLKKTDFTNFFVTNCDVIIEHNYAEIFNFHKENKNDMTIVVSCKHYVIPYGVCLIKNGGELKNIREKPEYDLLVNTGVYLINQRLIKLIPADKRTDINELIIKAQAANLKIGVFPINEKNWIDIGQWEEYRSLMSRLRLI